MHTLNLLVKGIWQVALVGLVLGAGLPALFAVGLRALASGEGGSALVSPGRKGNPVFTVIGWICFALVVYAVGVGIMVIVAPGFGDKVAFMNGFIPHLVKK